MYQMHNDKVKGFRVPETLRTCTMTTVHRGGLEFCARPAAFHYAGIVRMRAGLTRAHTIQKFGQMHHDLCMDHSREVFISMEPALRTGEATMRCLEFTKLTLHCSACRSTYRLEPLKPTTVRTADEESPTNGYYPIPNHFCPNCGFPSVASYDPTLDYWEILAKDLNLPINLTLQIYSLWMKDKTATAKFVEYIRTIMEELNG